MEFSLDFANLSLTALFTYLVLLTSIDVGVNVLLSLINRNFSGAYVADFIRTHILVRVFAIGALGVLGHGVPALGVPPIQVLTLAATGALAAYAIETVNSVRSALSVGTVPEAPQPAPQPANG